MSKSSQAGLFEQFLHSQRSWKTDLDVAYAHNMNYIFKRDVFFAPPVEMILWGEN
jgi:hypothetical protein